MEAIPRRGIALSRLATALPCCPVPAQEQCGAPPDSHCSLSPHEPFPWANQLSLVREAIEDGQNGSRINCQTIDD